MSNGDYLWDRSGRPDPEIKRLENLLSPLAYRSPKQGRRPSLRIIAGAIAAAVFITAGILWTRSRPHGPSWQVVALAGNHHQQSIATGSTVHTDATSRIRLELEAFGHVDVEPNTRLKLLTSSREEQRMSLQRGKIHAFIWAPPKQFYVDTPSAVAVDLGCSYTLEVDEAEDSTVHVDVGWVAFENHGRESFIPAGAICITRRGKGPGIPYYDDAPAGLVAAVARFDSNADESAVAEILRTARPNDAITLWHLLRRVRAGDRPVVFDRLSQVIKVPASIQREAVLRGDMAAIDALWDALGLGDTAWWRTWKTKQ